MGDRVRRETVWKWHKDPKFLEELTRARRDRLVQAKTLLDAMVPTALELLGSVLKNEEHPISVRVRAASEVLDRAGWTSRAGEVKRAEAYLQDAAATLRFQVPPDSYRTFLAALNAASGLTLPIPARSPLEQMSREELEGRIRGMG